jgi:DNA-binding FadR family transcriptional regulator
MSDSTPGDSADGPRKTDGWTPISRVRTHEQVMAQIEERILSGRLRVGDHLPSERELAGLLGVSRPSLRESLRVLEALGILDIRRGGGGEGGAFLTGSSTESPVEPLTLQLALGHFSHRELLDTRLALETWACRRAAEDAGEADIADLSGILDCMDAPGISSAQFNALDVRFHVRIAEASGNALTARLMSTLRRAINRQMVQAYARLSDWTETAATVRTEHRAIVAAIAAHDPEGAADRVCNHITDFYATVPVEGFER